MIRQILQRNLFPVMLQNVVRCPLKAFPSAPALFHLFLGCKVRKQILQKRRHTAFHIDWLFLIIFVHFKKDPCHIPPDQVKFFLLIFHIKKRLTFDLTFQQLNVKCSNCLR